MWMFVLSFKRVSSLWIRLFRPVESWGKTIHWIPEGRWCDPGPTQVEWTQGICLGCLSEVTHSDLQVLLTEELICKVELLQWLTPFLGHHVDPRLRRWQPNIAAEILSPEQTLKLCKITQKMMEALINLLVFDANSDHWLYKHKWVFHL